MKKVTLKVTGGRGDKIARFHDCGKKGESLYGRAKEILSEGSDAVKSFIEENFEAPDVEMFKHSLDRSGCIYVRVESKSGHVVFEDDECDKTSQRGFVRSDPRRWQFDKSMGRSLTARIRKYIEEQDADIEAALAKWREDHPGEDYDESVGEDYLCDFVDGLNEIIVQAPFWDAGYAIDSFYMKSEKKSPPLLFAVMCADLYGTGYMTCDIELEDGEAFDPDKLHLLLNDYEGFYYNCSDAALPVALYGDKFYRLSRDSWESHYEYYGFAEKAEGVTYFEFSGPTADFGGGPLRDKD